MIYTQCRGDEIFFGPVGEGPWEKGTMIRGVRGFNFSLSFLCKQSHKEEIEEMRKWVKNIFLNLTDSFIPGYSHFTLLHQSFLIGVGFLSDHQKNLKDSQFLHEIFPI
jgi:hypothetical protein